MIETVMLQLSTLSPALHLSLTVLGGLVVLGQFYIAATPTRRDDAWYARLEAKAGIGALLRALKTFAPIQRKGE